MNSKLVLIAALAAGTLTAAAQAQTTSPQPPASAAPAAATPPPPPQAVPAKIAIIELQEVASATNEGQNSIAAVQKKYEPTKQKLDGERAEIDSLTKQLQSAPATMPEEEKQSRARAVETKQKQLQLEADDASTSYGTEVQEAIGKVMTKLGPLVVKYVQQNGYTMLLDNAAQQQQQQAPGGLNLLWGGTDISQAVVDAYNAAYPAAAPVPSAPTATRRAPAARPAPKQ